MSINFSDGFLFAVGWIAAKVAMHIALSFTDQLLCKVSPKYRNIRDEQDRKKHPWRYQSQCE